MSKLVDGEVFNDSLKSLHDVWCKMGYDAEEQHRMENTFKVTIESQMLDWMRAYVQVCLKVQIVNKYKKEKDVKKQYKEEIAVLRQELCRLRETLSIPDSWYSDSGMCIVKKRLFLETVTQTLYLVSAQNLRFTSK